MQMQWFGEQYRVSEDLKAFLAREIEEASEWEDVPHTYQAGYISALTVVQKRLES